jgi:transcriptional regulator GlxA family with amidase domain
MGRRVVFVMFPRVQSLDLTGPVEVFAATNRIVSATQPSYHLEVVAPCAEAVTTSSGLMVTPHHSLAASRGPIDTLVVAGGEGVASARQDRRLVAWLARAAARSRRVASVCTGAFLLADAGLLDGRQATTHWASCDRLGQEFPSITVAPDRIFVRDDPVWTSAGVTAGMDLALALVEADLGSDVARQAARWLVMFVQRPGGQAQFSAQMTAQRPERPALQELEGWIAEHLDTDLSVSALAWRCGMSVRTFARAFRAEFGVTPGAYVEAVRIEAARRLLETTARGVADVARGCGFGTVETMYRSFQRTIRVSPGQYRRHFADRASA